MTKYTIEELYRRDKYSILSAFGAKAILSLLICTQRTDNMA